MLPKKKDSNNELGELDAIAMKARAQILVQAMFHQADRKLAEKLNASQLKEDK